jgi:adenylate kinase family enzyme
MRARRPTAVLITRAYGAGKTTTAEEIAAALERADLPFAAIDLDWLAWANLDDHGPEAQRILHEERRDRLGWIPREDGAAATMGG